MPGPWTEPGNSSTSKRWCSSSSDAAAALDARRDRQQRGEGASEPRDVAGAALEQFRVRQCGRVLGDAVVVARVDRRAGEPWQAGIGFFPVVPELAQAFGHPQDGRALVVAELAAEARRRLESGVEEVV